MVQSPSLSAAASIQIIQLMTALTFFLRKGNTHEQSYPCVSNLACSFLYTAHLSQPESPVLIAVLI